MDSTFFPSLLTSQAPWLPEPGTQYWGLHGAWGLVLGALTFLLGGRLQFKWRGWAATAVAAWCLWPGLASPSYWLGLAFQSPSLTSVMLCIIWASGSLKNGSLPVHDPKTNISSAVVLAGVGSLLGWILLGDTLAWWQSSVYAFGFSTWAVVLACLAVLSLWCADDQAQDVQAIKIGCTAVLLLFVLFRLPTGNLWDALIDPWLWIILQIMGLRMVIRCLLRLLRVSQATRV